MTDVFEEIDKRFAQKMRDAVAEVRAEEIQDWSRIERMTAQYGGFLDLFPEALPPKGEPAKKTTAKKAPAKKAPAKKATSRSPSQVPVKKK